MKLNLLASLLTHASRRQSRVCGGDVCARLGDGVVWLTGLLGVMIFDGFFGLIGLPGLTSLAAQEIHLLPQAEVVGGIIRLGDVAEIQGGTAADRSALQDLALRPFGPDQPMLGAREVREALLADGWNLLYWQVTGANQIQLRSATSATQGSRRTLRQASSASDSRLAVPPAGTRFPPTPPAAQRTGIVQAQWRETLLAESTTERPATPTGAATAPITSTAPRTTRAIPTSQVWAFKQDMSRGQVISADDLEWITLPRSTPLGAVTDQEQIVGQVLRTSLPAGRPIVSQYLEAIKYVQRGKEVKLLSRLGGIEVSTTARAQADGTLGQTITIESLDRKRQYFGQIIGFSTVEVVSSEQLSSGGGYTDTVAARDSNSPATLSRRPLPNTLRR